MTTDIATIDQVAPLTLFGTNEPNAIISAATKQADALAAVIRDKKLASNISGKEYVRVEGWTLLGTMLGVFPVCTWTRVIENGWEARVEARTMDGRVVGAAEAQCTHDEGNWRSRDEFALRSMAQTRATSKALRLPLGFVMALAGYETTPAEEMPVEAPSRVVENAVANGARVIEGQAQAVTGPTFEPGLQGPPPSAPPTNEVLCRFCNSDVYDNTAPGAKRSANGPDYKCKKCGSAAWIQAGGDLHWKKAS